MNASNFPTDITQDFDMSQALNIETPASYRGQAVLVSLLGRANYTFKDRYIFTASFRRDGSSRFAPGNKFANFASRSSSMDYIGRRIHQKPEYIQ